MADPLVVNLATPALPAREETVTREKRLPGQETAAARADLAAARGDVTEASRQQAELETQGGRLEAERLEMEERERSAAAFKQQELENQRVEAVRAAIEQDKALVQDIAKAAAKKNQPNAGFWQGNRTAEVFAAFARGIDRAISTITGQTGPTGVERVLEEKINAHERAVIGEWEATKEARQLAKDNAAAYQAELEKRKLAATSQSAAEIERLKARFDKFIAQLAPEKAEQARVQRDATAAAADALLDRKYGEGYDVVSRHAQTEREKPADERPGGLTDKDFDKYRGLQAARNNADKAMAEIEKIIRDNDGVVPIEGRAKTLYDGAVNRAAKAVALVESGNPDSEASDPTIRAVSARIGAGPAKSALRGAFEAKTFSPEAARKKGGQIQLDAIKQEREALDRKLESFIESRKTAPGAAAPGAAPAPPAGGAPTKGQTGVSKSGRPMKWNGEAWEYTDG